jgi:hypothetical protein
MFSRSFKNFPQKNEIMSFSFLDFVQIGVDVMGLTDGRHTTEEKRREFFRLMRRQFTDDEWVNQNVLQCG